MNFFATTNTEGARQAENASTTNSSGGEEGGWWGVISSITKTTQELTKEFTTSLRDENEETFSSLGLTRDSGDGEAGQSAEKKEEVPSGDGGGSDGGGAKKEGSGVDDKEAEEENDEEDRGRGSVQERVTKRIDQFGANLDDKLLKVENALVGAGGNVWSWFGYDDEDGKSVSSKGKKYGRNVNASRLREQEMLIESNPATYKRDPENREEFEKMKETFSKEDIKKQGSLILQTNERVRSFYVEFVPQEVSEDLFWYRYIFRIREVEMHELNRQKEAQARQEQKEHHRKKEMEENEDFEWDDAPEPPPTQTQNLQQQPQPQPSSSNIQNNKSTSQDAINTEADVDMVKSDTMPKTTQDLSSQKEKKHSDIKDEEEDSDAQQNTLPDLKPLGKSISETSISSKDNNQIDDNSSSAAASENSWIGVENVEQGKEDNVASENIAETTKNVDEEDDGWGNW